MDKSSRTNTDFFFSTWPLRFLVGTMLLLATSSLAAQEPERPKLRFTTPTTGSNATPNKTLIYRPPTGLEITDDSPAASFDGVAASDKSPMPSPTAKLGGPFFENTESRSKDADPHPAYSPMRLTPAVPKQAVPKQAAGSISPERTEAFRPLLPRPVIRRSTSTSKDRSAVTLTEAPDPPGTARSGEANRNSGNPTSVPPLRETVQVEPVNRDELIQVLQNGTELEDEARWRDVLNHYETALRIFRNDDALMERYRLARFHYDIGLRFHDSSYLRILHSMSFVEALKFYENVVTTIQSEYVDLSNWDTLFRHGVNDLEIALSDPVFLRQAGLKNAPEKAKAYADTMRKTADGWEIRNRDDMRNGILRLAEIAYEQIGLNPVLLLMEFTCGVINSLDPYTAYLTPNLLNDQMSIISGNLVGLGVELGADRESLMILRVIQGSPAEEGGLKDGDRILSVDGVLTKGRDTDDAANLLQGEEGSVVRLLVQSKGLGQRPREVRITRRQIEVPSVENVRMLNNYLGYIKLTGFQSKTCTEMKRALAELDRGGMQCLVLDMRKNPGGLFLLGVEVASLFIEEGAIVRTKGRNSRGEIPYMATQGETWKVPLIVLIDEESASAAEIVAGAIRDHNRGIIIGKRSYGKGTIQKILPQISEQGQGGMRLTVEKFYSPKGWPYSGVGVSPDVTVDVEKRWSLAKLVDGRLQIPVQSRTVSCDPNDPFIRQAMKTARDLVSPSTALRN